MNYFDYICFPKKDQRKQCRVEYFDAMQLKIDDKFITGKNSSLENQIINFNNTVVYLDLSVLQMHNYYALFTSSTDKDNTIYEILLRQAYRNLSCEIYIYEEKIKNFLRYIFDIDKNIRDMNDFMKLLEEKCRPLNYGDKFLSGIKRYNDQKEIHTIKNIRNDEIHNSPCYLNAVWDKENAKENDLHYQTFKKCLYAMKDMKTCFQSLLVNLYDDGKWHSFMI